MVILYDNNGKRLIKGLDIGWSFSQKRNKEGTGKLELAEYPVNAKYVTLYKDKEKIKDMVISDNASNDKQTTTNIRTLESLFKNYKIPESWHGWDDKPLNFVLSDCIYGFDYIRRSTLEDFTNYIEKVNIDLNKIKDGDIHLQFHEVGDAIQYYEEGSITFAFDCGDVVSDRYIRWTASIGEKTYIGVQSVSSHNPITNIGQVDFSHAPILTANRGVEEDSSIRGVKIASDKRYVAVRFILKYINADWTQDFATHKVYNEHNILVDRTVRGFTPVLRAFEIITRKKTEFNLKFIPPELQDLVTGLELSNCTLWEAIQKIREKYTFDTRCYFEKGTVYFEFNASFVKNKIKQADFILRTSDKKNTQLNNTNIKELKTNVQKINVLHCYGEGEKQQRLYVRVPGVGTYDGMPTVEDIFTDTKIKTREELQKAGLERLKEKRGDDNPIFEVETLQPIRLFDKVSLVHPETETVYNVIVEEESIAYKGGVLSQKFGLGGFLFNPFDKLVQKKPTDTDTKIILPPLGVTATAKDTSIVLEWEGAAEDYVIQWKEKTQSYYNYRTVNQKKETFERLENNSTYLFSVAAIFNGVLSPYSAEIECTPTSDKVSFPAETESLAFYPADETPQELPEPDPSYTAWQKNIIEYECSGKTIIEMTFKEALHDCIILNGTLENDFVLKLFFDEANGNGTKYYLIIFKLEGNYNLTITTGIKNTRSVTHPITNETYGLGCYVVVDRKGNVFHFKGEKGSGSFGDIDTTNIINDEDFFIIEQDREAKKADKVTTLTAIQKYDSPIGEIKTFYDDEYKHGFLECNGAPFSPDVFPDFTEYVKNTFHLGVDTHTGWPFRPLLKDSDAFSSPLGEIKTFYDDEYKHGFLECNGLPFSPSVFPELTEYVKRIFKTKQDKATGWQLRPLIERTDGTKVFIKAVTDSGKKIYIKAVQGV
ncbi:fibronectin type III domain-containing protein [Treponema phagedenis]|uniref:fibronectin type III domain-containing protein n=1 Tax=Treponema phagedenis TaxID=162 RepID=UPI0011E679DD|nr:fibronectin type III domain-containing protein [Treponema phagedenis]NVP23227.1 fibronectin type III domain-containing protein [Treponema phagedenis]QEK01178.1 fibronectin type III domain-containing protein [Treponema phagedenis]QKS92556.1 fibronectin type III domain-containing protein [Treponema phagedenis]QLC58088.1 fibronectin type III domain-containing protein [Treponema phagedenis]